MTKVYAALGSGVVFSIISGFIATKGLLPWGLVAFLFVATLITEIVLVFTSRSNKFAQNYLKPGTFYGFALCFGAMMGNVFGELQPVEKKA